MGQQRMFLIIAVGMPIELIPYLRAPLFLGVMYCVLFCTPFLDIRNNAFCAPFVDIRNDAPLVKGGKCVLVAIFGCSLFNVTIILTFHQADQLAYTSALCPSCSLCILHY